MANFFDSRMRVRAGLHHLDSIYPIKDLLWQHYDHSLRGFPIPSLLSSSHISSRKKTSPVVPLSPEFQAYADFHHS